ncbi:Telomere-associated protein RIF1, partial [Mucuna pruriens]
MSEEIQEIHSLISSDDKLNKSLGYSALLQFQQHSCLNPSSLQSLAHSSKSIISSIVSDISGDHDEEIAAQALKCLGFMLYHPSVVSFLRVDDISSVLGALPKLITTTKLKASLMFILSACNLGVWCLSVQQLGASFLVIHFYSLLRAIVHALDNPMGSLSTTFEATQAVMKLSGQLSEQMKGSSHIWAPPIYRRLLSIDKRERDASERCLLKIRSTVIPPSLDLSKVIAKDMKIKLLNEMKDLLDNGMKIQAIRAWGWFVRMLGSHALKNRHLVNDMLKIPERTFTDLVPQVQIATQVAWEGLIDALVHCPIFVSERNTSTEGNSLEKQHSLGRKSCDDQANGFSKSIKLIMTPLIGIMSSKCDISVRSSCFNTWCYLLHKLDIYINEPSMIKMVLEPILKAIFQNGPDSKNICLWNLGLDLLSDSISQKCRDVLYQATGQVSHRISENEPSLSGKCSWKQNLIRWMPWNINQLDFYLSMNFHLIYQASKPAVTYDHRSHVYDISLKLFMYILNGVKLDVESPSTDYDGIMQCLNSLLTFIKKVCEDLCSDVGENYDVYCTSIQFIDAITKELGPSILGSPLYKFSLDLKYIGDMQSVDHNNHLKFLSVSCISYMDKVSPLVYLIALYFRMMVQLTMKSHQADHVSQGMCEYFKFIFCSSDCLENLVTSIAFLYRHVQPIYLNIWIALAQGLSYCASDANCKPLQEALSDSTVYSSICHLLIYPIVAHSEVPRMTLSNASASLDKYPVSPERKQRFELVIQTWKSLYTSLSASRFGCSSATNFSEDLCMLLSSCLDEGSMVESSTDFELTCNDVDLGVLHLSGNFLICILEQIQTWELVSELDRSKFGRDRKILFCIKNCLKFVDKHMNLLRIKMVRDPPPGFVGTSRLYSALACFISRLHWKQDILHFLQIVSSPLLQWLSNMGTQDEQTNDQLQLLWTEILSCLRRSQPPINFGSALLKLHEPLFDKTLDHPYPSISEPTINFWNSTFGQQIILDFPLSLLCVLDKLSRSGRLKLQKRSLPCLKKCHSHEGNDAAQGYRVSAKHNRTSKRVELVLDTLKEAPPLSFKKRRLELTEHQKEVRRAQQGRERDAGGHGPGIRTYTNADFSQARHDDSQESQEEIRDSEAILQMLIKTI